MKVGFFDYLLDELKNKDRKLWGRTLDKLRGEFYLIKDPLKIQGFHISYSPASKIEANHHKYDLIIFHPPSLNDDTKVEEINDLRRILIDTIKQPTLIVGSETKTEFIEEKVGKRDNLELGHLLNVWDIKHFIEKYSGQMHLPFDGWI
ncbi:MAG: hypothetical protein V1831_03155 [Candidatus Woesearchaeota archaeon]